MAQAIVTRDPPERTLKVVYHLLDERNWTSVQTRGLLSAQRLAQLSGNYPPAHLRLQRLRDAGLDCGAVIRDQRPMPPAALVRCLQNGLRPGDWYSLLNSKVFFWLDVQRMNRQRLAFDLLPQRVLVLDADRMLARYGRFASVTPINTGNAMRAAAVRNDTTFVPYDRWRADGWTAEQIAGRRPRPRSHKPVELTIPDAVSDVLSYVTQIISLGPGETL